MCLAVPGKLIDTENIGESRIGKVQFGGSLLAGKPERENEQGEIPRFPRSKD